MALSDPESEQYAALNYNAFISYSHAADGKLAPALQDGLHRFAKSWIQLRALRVFRDDASLSANPGLWSSIDQALSQSEFFILLASPEAARSEWVSKEVAWWCRNKPIHRLLIVLTGGTIRWDANGSDFDWECTDALPACLRGVFEEEPRLVDLAWARTREQVSLEDPRFRDAVADIASPLHHRPKDELIGEDVRMHRRALLTRRFGFAAISILAISAIIVALVALRQRNVSLYNESVFLAELARQQTSSASSITAIRLALTGLPTPRGDAASLQNAWQRLWQRPHVAETEAALAQAMYEGRERVRFVGHDGSVLDATLSSTGEMVVTASADRTARVWDAHTGEERLVLRGHEYPVVEARFSPNTERIVTAAFSEPPRLWNAETGTPIAVLPVPTEGIARFGTDGKTVVVSHRYTGELLSVIDGLTGAPLLEASPGEGSSAALAYSTDGEAVLRQSPDGRQIVEFPLTSDTPVALRGQAGPVDFAVFSADHRLVLTASSTEQATKIWATDTGALVSILRAQSGDVSYALFSSGGDVVLTRSSWREDTGYVTHLWDVRSGDIISVLRDQSREFSFNYAYFSPDDRWLATVEADVGYSRLWNVQTGMQVMPDDRLEPGGDPVGMAFDNPLGFSPDSALFASASGSAVALWSSQTGKLVALLTGHAGRVGALEFSANGKSLVTASDDGTARLWEVTVPTPAVEAAAGDERISSILFGPGGKHLITVVNQRTVQIWTIAPRLEKAARLECAAQWSGVIRSAVFSPDGTMAVAACRDGSVLLWEAANGVSTLVTQKGVDSAVFTADSARLVVLTAYGRAEVWDLATREQQLIIDQMPRRTPLKSILTDERGSILLVLDHQGNARLWHLSDGTENETFATESSARGVYAARFSPNGRDLVTLSGDGLPEVWDLATGKLRMSFAEEAPTDEGLQYMAFGGLTIAPDGSRIVTVSENGTARLFDAETGHHIAWLRSDAFGWGTSRVDRPAPVVAFSPDGTRVVTTSYVSEATVWDSDTGEQLAVLSGQRDDIVTAAFNTDGARLVTIADGTMRLWDALSGALLARFRAHEFAVTEAAFSPNGEYLYTGSDDGFLRVWRLLPTGQTLIRVAHERVSDQPFTRQEQQQFGLQPAR